MAEVNEVAEVSPAEPSSAGADKKKTGLIITGVTALLCGCPGLCSVAFGALMAGGGGLDSMGMEGIETSGDPVTVGIIFLCLGLIMSVIPVGAGIWTFVQSRGQAAKAEAADVDVPPAI